MTFDILIGLATFIFAALGVIWRNNNLLNLQIKVMLLIMMNGGLVYLSWRILN